MFLWLIPPGPIGRNGVPAPTHGGWDGEGGRHLATGGGKGGRQGRDLRISDDECIVEIVVVEWRMRDIMVGSGRVSHERQ